MLPWSECRRSWLGLRSATHGRRYAGVTPRVTRPYLTSVAAFGAALAAALAAAQGANADTPVIRGGSTAQTAFEQVASQIASHISGRAVVVRCDSQADWDARGLSPFELGFVSVLWTTFGGIAIGRNIDTVAHLAPGVCDSLIKFAAATTKPTKCSVVTQELVTRQVRVVSHVAKTVVERKKVNGRWVYVKTRMTVPIVSYVTRATTAPVAGPPLPCYANRQPTNSADSNYWTAYKATAYGLLALAHESIHLGGVVGGTLTSGIAAGDQQAEAKANCYGMQWMPYVAQQLGAEDSDAISVAQYTWDVLYSTYRGSAYWSSDCAPGGAMDIRSDKSSSIWP